MTDTPSPQPPADRRYPACGNELEHGPHPFTAPAERWCAGWTADEADLCEMIAEVRDKMARCAPPGSVHRFRLECHRTVLTGLHMLLLANPQVLHGAEITVIAGWKPGTWRLTELQPALAAGVIRPQAPAAADPEPGVPIAGLHAAA